MVSRRLRQDPRLRSREARDAGGPGSLGAADGGRGPDAARHGHGDGRIHVAGAGRGPRLDFRSDQFSFGSILYEMATGKRAFERGTTAETLTAIIREEPESVAQLNRGCRRRCAGSSNAACQGPGGPLRHDQGSRARPRRRPRSPLGGLETTTDQTAAAAAAAPRAEGVALAPRRGGPGGRRSGRRVRGRQEERPRRAAGLQRAHVPARRDHSARFAPDGQTIV